jgi:hypothetical protein
VHVPVATNVTDEPATVHTAGVVEEKVTASPDDAVALTVTGDCANVLFASVPNVIVCAAWLTVKFCCTDGAGLYVPLPAWSACTVHVPAASNVTDEPATVHTAGVVDEKVTASPDDAVALTVTGDCNNVLFANAANVIVCDALLTEKLCCTDGAGLYDALPA